MGFDHRDQLIDHEDQLSNYLFDERRKLANKLMRGVPNLPINNSLCTPSTATKIGDPFRKIRLWLGTCTTAEEAAAAAYKAKKEECDNKMALERPNNLQIDTKVVSEEFNGLCFHPSPSSVPTMSSLGHGLESNVEMVSKEWSIESSIKEESSAEMIGESS
uniref:AP2/ERF domain-containing protein n=1 Tax=Salix viminalis TaxID=40686 RepID=A0A6N2KE31_SALVM